MLEMSSKGKEFNEISRDTEQKLNDWLIASGIEKEQLIERLENGSIDIQIEEEKNNIQIKIIQKGDCIGLPFVYNSDSLGNFEDEKKMFFMDVILILMAAIADCNDKTYAKIKEKIMREIFPLI